MSDIRIGYRRLARPTDRGAQELSYPPLYASMLAQGAAE